MRCPLPLPFLLLFYTADPAPATRQAAGPAAVFFPSPPPAIGPFREEGKRGPFASPPRRGLPCPGGQQPESSFPLPSRQVRRPAQCQKKKASIFGRVCPAAQHTVEITQCFLSPMSRGMTKRCPFPIPQAKKWRGFFPPPQGQRSLPSIGWTAFLPAACPPPPQRRPIGKAGFPWIGRMPTPLQLLLGIFSPPDQPFPVR